MTEKPVDGAVDPYSPENIGTIHFIQLGRIYDVLMAMLTEMNPDAADNLMEAHSTGSLVGSAPFFNGKFIADLLEVKENQ